MVQKAEFENLGLIDYKKAWDIQEQKLASIVESKKNKQPFLHHLYFCEHPHVYTLGKSGEKNNLLANPELLKQINADFYEINRGGDITYHGPGQIVGYPIFDLESLGIQVRKYIYMLEEAVINCLKQYNIHGGRLEGATGVWLDPDIPGKSRKICAIGVRASRFVTMHGFALNVGTDLKYFSYINPCGFIDKGVTSVEKELGKKVDINRFRNELLDEILKVFSLEIE